MTFILSIANVFKCTYDFLCLLTHKQEHCQRKQKINSFKFCIINTFNILGELLTLKVAILHYFSGLMNQCSTTKVLSLKLLLTVNQLEI